MCQNDAKGCFWHSNIFMCVNFTSIFEIGTFIFVKTWKWMQADRDCRIKMCQKPGRTAPQAHFSRISRVLTYARSRYFFGNVCQIRKFFLNRHVPICFQPKMCRAEGLFCFGHISATHSHLFGLFYFLLAPNAAHKCGRECLVKQALIINHFCPQITLGAPQKAESLRALCL